MTTNSPLLTDQDFELSIVAQSLLLLCQLLTLLSLAPELALWMNATIGLCLLWQCAYILKVFAKPNKYLVFIIAILGAVAIAISGKELGLLLSMIHLICFAYAVKAMELNTRKDFFQLILLGIFLLACAFIYKQSVWFASIIFLLVAINLAMLYLYFAQVITFTQSFKANTLSLLLSIPLALTMFLLFPRLEPFWQMPSAKSAKTGLSSEVKPGDIASLALSDELAFRVDFASEAPLSSSMYWRAMTLPVYDGKGWRRWRSQDQAVNDARLSLLDQDKMIKNGSAYQYQVIAEASFQRWLFALDLAEVTDHTIYQLSDFSLLAQKPINKTIAYDVTSYYQAPLDQEMSTNRQAWYTRIPESANPKLVKYAAELVSTYSDPNDIIEHVLKHFSIQEYFYTLQPPTLNNNNLDEFFFETQSGFCEHYASTFAFIMRAANIPARLVTGYLGGEYNPQGSYYSIYQYDAHAWTEVWLEGRGWVRIDPTAAVSPDRIERGLSQTLADEKSALSTAFFRGWSQLVIFNQIKLQLEAIDYQWTRLVVGYSIEKQTNFLNELFGQGKVWKSVGVFIGMLLFISMIFWLLSLRSAQKVGLEKWQKGFDRFLTLMTRAGFERDKGHTIKEYFQQAAQQIDDKEGLLTCLWLSFYRLSYQVLNDDEKAHELTRFKRHLKDCHHMIKPLTKQQNKS